MSRIFKGLTILSAAWMSVTTPALGGSLFVADYSAGNGFVRQFDSSTGALQNTLNVPGGIGFPGGLAIGPDGSLFFAGADENAIFRFDSGGTFAGVFANTGLSGPSGLAFGPDGNLYVANTASGSSFITRYNGTTGALVDTFVPAGSGPSGGLFNPAGITFGPNGSLYVSDLGNGSIAAFDGTTAAYTSFVPAGSPPSPLAGPQGLAFGPDGNLYVADVTTSTVHRYDGLTGAYMDEFIGNSGGLGQPIGLAFGPDGNLYVTDGLGRVVRFNGLTGALIGDFTTAGDLINPQFLAFADSSVPEPGTAALLGLGLAAFALLRRR